jgi:hypothetical protein
MGANDGSNGRRFGPPRLQAVPPGAVPLGVPSGIPVKSKQIICPAMIEARIGGLAEDQCDLHLRVVNMLDGDVWLIPLPSKFARTLGQRLLDQADSVDQSQTEET